MFRTKVEHHALQPQATVITEQPKPFSNSKSKEEQIIETRDKPQHLATQRLLSCLQYPDTTKSSTKDLSLQQIKFMISW